MVEDNLVQALHLEPGSAELRRLAKDNFCHYGILLFELLRLQKLAGRDFERTITFFGLEHFDAARAEGKGVLALTAHLGNYDLMAMAVARSGYPVTIISKPLKNKALERVWMEQRSASGLNICLSRNSMRDIIRALRRNDIVGFILDQHARLDAVWVDFFGRPAATLRSMAVLAQRTGARVVPAFTWRQADNSHVIEVQPGLDFESVGDPEADIRHNTERYTALIEAAVRRHPEQWTWIHRRWKDELRPVAEKGS